MGCGHSAQKAAAQKAAAPTGSRGGRGTVSNIDPTVLDVLLTSIFIADRACKIVYANEAALRLSGYTSIELLGRPIELLMRRSVAIKHQRLVDDYRRTGHGTVVGNIECGVRIVRRDGSCVPVLMSVTEIDELFVASFIEIAPIERILQRATAAEVACTEGCDADT